MRLHFQFALVLGCCALSPAATRAQACEPGTECEPDPIACETNADCPLGLECETTRTVESCPTSPGGDDPPAGDGGCTIEEEPVEAPSCVYAPVLCTQNSECDTGLSCQALGRVEQCNSAPEGNCLPGDDCEQAPSEPVCTRQQQSYCFPVRHDCTSSSECDEGWRCTMLPEHALEGAPTGWEGATKICVPEGIALFLEGRIKVGTISESVADDRAIEGTGSNVDADDGEPASEAMSGSGGACSVSAALPTSRPARHVGVHALWLLVLGLLGTRSLAKRRV